MNPTHCASGFTLDAGALIAYERNAERVRGALREARRREVTIAVPAGAIAQAWRGGARQAQLSRLLRSPDLIVVPLSLDVARAAGELCGQTGTSDAIDASVALCALQLDHIVVTSDPAGLKWLAPNLRLYPV